MTRTWLAVPLLAVALTTGCSGSDDSPTAAPPTASTSAPAPTGSPLTVESHPGGESCQLYQGPFIEALPMKVSRAATISRATLLGGSNVSFGKATVTAAPSGTQLDGYALQSREPSATLAKELGWDGRQPLAGAQLDPGRYFVFLPVQVGNPNAHFDGFAIAWTEGDQTGKTRAEEVTDFKDRC